MTWKASRTRTAGGRPAGQGGAVTAEGVHGGYLDVGSPLGGLIKEPVGQHFAASPRDDVDELPAMQVDDAGGDCRAPGSGTGERRLIYPDPGHPVDAVGSSINAVP
jgi:hypothetical protein